MNVLAVDDEIKILEVISAFLNHKGMQVLTAQNGTEALKLFETQQIDFVLLDLMLPDISGEEICRRIRKKSDVPVIMLTAKSQETDMLNGLGIGADDYIRKPFSLKELYMRMQTILRRIEKTYHIRKVGELSIDFQKCRLCKNDSEILLTASEWKLLSVLVENAGIVLSREQLISGAFGMDFEAYDRAVDTHIKNLRKKIEADSRNPVYIRTVHGLGYKFEVKS
ncbi:MAG: response regulator transcription factor [Oscillospiraceae bacterium]|nr:response regulator transcription factor [Oscillospiraceae bacterium]